MPSLSPDLAWQALLAKKVAATDSGLDGYARFLRLLVWMETLHDPGLVLATHPWRHLEQLAIIHAGQPHGDTFPAF
jgi:hypothetical protein